MPALADELTGLGFRAEANPSGRAVDLRWELPDPAGDPAALAVTVLRRERRFPGRNRRGVVSVAASGADLTDGVTVFPPPGVPPLIEEIEHEGAGERRITTVRRYAVAGRPRDRVFAGSLRREYAGAAPVRATMRVVDRDGLQPGTIYYYTAFVGPQRLYSRLSQASALVTEGATGRLQRRLPRVDQLRDTVTAPAGSVPLADAAKGQLHRFLDVVDAHAALLAGLTRGLRELHDPRRADSRVLDALGRQLGWRLKEHLDEDAQRNEIAFAPHFHRSVGTGPGVAAMVNRLTGWDTRVREFVANVLGTWDASRVERLETRQVYLDGSLGATAGDPSVLIAGRRVPPGSLDTSDPAALYRMRTHAFDDAGAYSYDCGRPDSAGRYQRDDTVLYNRETVGVYVVPDVDAEPFGIEQEWRRARDVVEEFLPIQVRVVFVLRPGVIAEEPYEATKRIGEVALDAGRLAQAETYGDGGDAGTDAIPAWTALSTNELAHRSVDTAAAPVVTAYRSWHTAVMRPA
jgi:phage tail-like protein